MAVYNSLPKGQEVTIFPAATTGTGSSYLVPVSDKNPVFSFRGAGTISGGTVLLEEAMDPDYSGTWSVLYTLTASNLTGGATQVIHILGSVRAVRVRVSSNITGAGGSITGLAYAA